MNNKITAGIWFVGIGIILLLQNFDIIDFNFFAILKYWPIFIVILGINMIFQNKPNHGWISVSCSIIFFSFLVIVGLNAPKTNLINNIFNKDSFSIEDNGQPFSKTVSSPYDAATPNAALNFNGGAGSFILHTDEKELFHAASNNGGMEMQLQSNLDKDTQNLEVNAKSARNNKRGEIVMGLNPAPLWKLNFNYGAANIKGDLQKLRIANLEINSGASNLELTLGLPPIAISKIEIATGASKIHLHIPKDAAIKVEYTSIVSKNNFEGFASQGDGEAKTANYDSATNKYSIEFNGAANTFSISRY